MVLIIRRVLTTFVLIGIWYRTDWTVAFVMTWFSIAVEFMGAAVYNQGAALRRMAERLDLLRQEVEDGRRKRA